MLPEFSPEEDVSLSVLGVGSKTCHARIVSAEGRRMVISCDESLTDGVVVKIVSASHLFLCEVRSRSDASGTALLQIRHSLRRPDLNEIEQHWR